MSGGAHGTNATGCGPRERALFFELLARAVDGEALEGGQRDAITAMDDSVLAFLVRALVNGRLAPDGRLFLIGEEIAIAEQALEMLKEGDEIQAENEDEMNENTEGLPKP